MNALRCSVLQRATQRHVLVPPPASSRCVSCAASGNLHPSYTEPSLDALNNQDALVCFYSDHWKVPLPPGHRFPMQKYRMMRQLLQEDPQCAGKIVFAPGPQASMEDLLLVHCPSYVDRFTTGQMTPKEVRNLGLPWSYELSGRSLSSSGSTVAATHLVLGGRHTMAANMAGGTHHAFHDRGEGFCVFNDISTAAAVAMRDYGLTRILIIDTDVHQGNGSSSIFENDPRVVTFDIHGANNYPYSSRMRSTYDVPLVDGTTDATFLPLLEKWLAYLVSHHQPQLVFFQAGVDALQGDSLGRLSLTRQGLLRRNNLVYSTCEQASLPLVITMGGGYTKPIDASVEAHADVYRSAAFRYVWAKHRRAAEGNRTR